MFPRGIRSGRVFWKLLSLHVMVLAVVSAAAVCSLGGVGRGAAVGVAGVLLLAGLVAVRRWGRRIRDLSESAKTLSRGELSARLPVTGRDEVTILARAINRMRDRLARQLHTIDHQRRTLDSLISQLKEGVIVADAEGRIVLINAEARRMLPLNLPDEAETGVGHTVEQCVAQHRLQEMLQVRAARHGSGPAVEPPHSDATTGTTDTGRSDVDQDALVEECRLQVDGAGGRRVLLARAFDIELPLLPRGSEEGSVGRRAGRMLMLSDVTELTRVMQVKADFAANASHELRTPLSAIRAALETLRTVDPAADANTAERFLQIIDRHARRMEDMARDLLDLTRLESPTARFAPAQIAPRQMLDELHHGFAEALAAKSLAWETRIAPECHTLVASPELVRMVLGNLIDNAVRFTDAGGHVGVGVWKERGEACFEVADDGCGIPQAEQSRIFERFYQVRRGRSGADRGTGLGLSIVRHAVGAMHGRVELQSEPGMGTVVRVLIPQPA